MENRGIKVGSGYDVLHDSVCTVLVAPNGLESFYLLHQPARMVYVNLLLPQI